MTMKITQNWCPDYRNNCVSCVISTHLEKNFQGENLWGNFFFWGGLLLSFDSMQLFNISISKTTRVHYKGYTDTVASVLKNGHKTQGTWTTYKFTSPKSFPNGTYAFSSFTSPTHYTGLHVHSTTSYHILQWDHQNYTWWSNFATSSQNDMLQLVNKTGTVDTNVNNKACSHNHCCSASIKYKPLGTGVLHLNFSTPCM
jgi:hypothetical protein